MVSMSLACGSTACFLIRHSVSSRNALTVPLHLISGWISKLGNGAAPFKISGYVASRRPLTSTSKRTSKQEDMRYEINATYGSTISQLRMGVI